MDFLKIDNDQVTSSRVASEEFASTYTKNIKNMDEISAYVDEI